MNYQTPRRLRLVGPPAWRSGGVVWFRLDVRKIVFSNRVIDSWNSLPTQCVNCNTVDTFKKYVSIALVSETDVNS